MLKVPSNYSEITIGEMQRLKGDDDVSLISVFAEFDDIRELKAAEIKLAGEHIREVLSMETQIHKKVIVVNGKEYGFIPDWEKFTQGQYMDICEYIKSPVANAHKIMSILYLPVTRKYGDKYEVEKYKGTKDADVFKGCPAELYNGAMLFFSTINRDFLKTSLYYLTAVTRPKSKGGKKRWVISGGGITRFRSWLTTTLKRLRG